MDEIYNQDYMSDCVEDWRKQIRASASSADRKGFMKTARTCDEFFRGTVGGMWDDDFRGRFLDNIPAPRFKLTVAKGFELVAIMGPTIMWDYPGRTNRGIKHINLPREYFQEGPNGDQQYQLYLEEAARLKALDKARSELMDAYQSYTPREQPGRDGLIGASRLAITDAIVKGRGCLVVDTYQFPGSDRTLTGAFYMSVDDLYIDPGCRHADLTDCLWMARRRRDKYWKLEERFGLPKGSLKDKCTSISSESAASHDSAQATSERSQGKADYNDTIVWYEIWSKCGVGMRGVRHRSKFVDKLDEVVGDYAYLAIADNVPYPLNYAPHDAKKINNDEVAEKFEWPTPYYLDGRWPIAMLDFYDVPGSAWPLAPMAMGLGELMFMNVVMSCLMERAYEACQSILAADESLSDDVMERLRQRDWSGVVECNVKGTNGGINDLIAFIKTPDLKSDVFAVLDAASESFNRRTGLADLLYGSNPGGKVSRSAADINIKHEAVNIRPEQMHRRAESWQTEVANLERIAAGWHVTGDDLVPLLGQQGAQAWDQLIYTEDPEIYVRQMRTTLEANSIKKPNKFRDNANIQQVIGYILPILREYWLSTGDPAPLNNFIQSMGEAMEQDPENWMLPEIEPQSQQDPEAEAMAQQKQQIDMESAVEGLRGKKLRNDKMEMESLPPMSPADAMMPPEEPVMPPEGDVGGTLPPEVLEALMSQEMAGAGSLQG